MSNGEATWEGKAVSLGQIDGQLQRLWRAADSQWDGEGRRPDIRTSVLNLVVYAITEDCEERAAAAIEHLAGTHPSRAIIIVPGRSNDEPSIDARLSIKSHGAYAEFRQVCSEQIALTVHGPASQHMASIVEPLLAPDLPVFLWWPGETPFHHHVYPQLRGLADRFIVDSSDFEKPEVDLVTMAHAVRVAGKACAFSDFNWARLEPWRNIIAQFFDVPEFRPYLDRLTGLWVEASPAEEGVAHVVPQVLLLGGWLCSALGLHAEQRSLGPERFEMLLANGTRKVNVDIRLRRSHGDAPIIIRLQAAGDPPAEFGLRVDAKSGQVTATATLGSAEPVVHKTTSLEREEAHILFHELEMFGHDPQYEEALIAASNMLDPNYRYEPIKGSLLV